MARRGARPDLWVLTPWGAPRILVGDAMVRSIAALTALEPRADERPARFALELQPEQNPRQVAQDVTAELAEFGPAVAPISPMDHGVLVLELDRRTLRGTDPARAFAAGYALAENFNLRTAEPDLPTPFFPEEDPPPPGVPVEEAFRFPPGCWVDADDGLPQRWAVDWIRGPQAWELSRSAGRPARGRGVVVAQPDTGVVRHAELNGVPRLGGYNVLDDDPDPTDPLTGANPGHGTGTASVAVSPDILRLTGSAPEATHMPIRAITSVIQATQVSVAAAIGRAVDDSAHVITMSLGGVPAAALQPALRRAVAADVFGHDPTTLGGSSGSPLLHWLDGAPSGFGLHFAGASVDTNIAHAVVACADKLRALGVAVEEPDP